MSIPDKIWHDSRLTGTAKGIYAFLDDAARPLGVRTILNRFADPDEVLARALDDLTLLGYVTLNTDDETYTLGGGA